MSGSPLAWGTVGWDGDGGAFYELGETGGDPNLLVRVTLFRGRDPNRRLDQSSAHVAQGQQVLSKIASTFTHIPPRGSRVLVAMPEPFGASPGGSMIIAADNPNPVLIGNLKDGEVGISSPSGKARILFKKATDAVVLYTQDSSGNDVMLYVGSDKIQIANAYGSLTCDSTGASFAHASGGSGLVLTATKATLSGKSCAVTGLVVACAGQVATCLGDGCEPIPGVNCVLVGPTGMAGMPCPTVYASQT